MSGGDRRVAVVTVIVQLPPVTKEVNFFRTADRPGALRATVAGSPFGTLQPDISQTISGWDFRVFFFYASAENSIRWNTVENDPQASQFVPLLSNGEVLPVTVAASSTSSATTSLSIAGPTTSAPATPEANSTVPVPTSQEKGAKGISGGALAGTAIGCLIAGILITGIVLWFCWGKRKGLHSRDYEASSTALMPQEKGFAVRSIPLGSRSPATSPASVALPLPLEDKSITSDMSKISSSIKNHVQSYYHMSRVSPGLIDMDDIQAMGDKQPISASALSALISNPTTREMALRFCIGWVACTRMQPNEDPETSLLPIELAGCARKITDESHVSTARDSSMFAQWRVTTAELLQDSYIRQPFSASDSRNINIQKATLTVDNILRPFADSRMDSGDRKRNLEEVLKRSALFAFTLFSQPSTWAFDWREELSATPRELCIFPALVQVSNENGEPVIPPRAFSEAIVRPFGA
ncbi:hypothetical protein BDU57DRAFT_535935 [Ampelomyces quisqualis]|uniref:Uncharacterized protein n=1 Tax=Ampelomyces quisqualis TaxID=50730 RepID=A0A6A5QYG1_AMPQU|nr:hypothetical protein BDU57DRAFT_535935 [Ampelomyces quisqualis]